MLDNAILNYSWCMHTCSKLVVLQGQILLAATIARLPDSGPTSAYLFNPQDQVTVGGIKRPWLQLMLV